MQKRLKLLIAASEDTADKPGVFQVKYGGEFAFRKFLPHITGYKDQNELCSRTCLEFRSKYDLDYSKDIAGILSFPSVLPELIDDPENYIEDEIPQHDVLLAIGIHPDILAELIRKAAKTGCKAIIVPRENPFWMNTVFANRVKGLCEDVGLECAFPRPFCSLTKGKSEVINQFITQFKIGRPDYSIFLDENDIVSDINVKCSSPCGATYFVTSGLLGLHMSNVKEAANGLWHSYPCLSSSKMDPEVEDSPLHMAAYINLYTVKAALKNARKGKRNC